MVLGHIRAVHRSYSADHGHKNEISEDNCHPFTFGRYSFMHNGGISKFLTIKRVIRESLPDHLYNEIIGTTDSEHLFAVLLDEIGDLEKELTAQELGDVLERTINRITKLSIKYNIEVGSSMNIIFTDGRHVVATRCRTNLEEDNPSLFYCVNSGSYDINSKIENENGINKSICISSEPMSSDPNWTMLPCNHMITVPCVEGEDVTLVKDFFIRPMNVDNILPKRQEQVLIPNNEITNVETSVETPVAKAMKGQAQEEVVAMMVPASIQVLIKSCDQVETGGSNMEVVTAVVEAIVTNNNTLHSPTVSHSPIVSHNIHQDVSPPPTLLLSPQVQPIMMTSLPPMGTIVNSEPSLSESSPICITSA